MATVIKIKNIPEGYQSFISNGRHALVGDEPVNSKGTDLGFSPPEFVLAGISMCKVATVRNVAKKPDGSFKTKITSTITIEGDITEEQRALLIKEADNCYITRLVRGEWEFADSEIAELA